MVNQTIPEIHSTQKSASPEIVHIHHTVARPKHNHHHETISPTHYCKRKHWPADLIEDLENGNYACMNDSPSKPINIDWSQQNRAEYATTHPWLYKTTQSIMEGGATAMDDYEIDSWILQIDEEIGTVEITEDGEWEMTNKQIKRTANIVASAIQWFKQQPMVRRLHRLHVRGWLAEQVRLYMRNRASWPRQMGPNPANETEQRLIEIWENSIKTKAPKVPSALDDYTEWWNLHDKQYHTARYTHQGKINAPWRKMDTTTGDTRAILTARNRCH
jgi:hypothetical protein